MSQSTYYERNKEKILNYNKLNREKIREYYKIWYLNNKSELLEKRKEKKGYSNILPEYKEPSKSKKTVKKNKDPRGTVDNLDVELEMIFY